MTPLDLPGLIVIGMRTLGLDTPGAIAELDVTAAQAALAEAAAVLDAPATPAAEIAMHVVPPHLRDIDLKITQAG